MLTAPGLLLLAAVIAFPVVWALFTSLFDYTLIDPGFHDFVGVQNYTHALLRRGVPSRRVGDGPVRRGRGGRWNSRSASSSRSC